MPLKVIVTRDFEHMSDVATERSKTVLARLESEKSEVVLGLATGNSPTGLYRRLAESANLGQLDSSKWRTFNLDEYVGLPGADVRQRGLHTESYCYFMMESFFSLLKKKPRATFLPEGLSIDVDKLVRELAHHPGDWNAEGTSHGRAIVIKSNPGSEYLQSVRSSIMDRYVERIQDAGGVDFQILGVGGRGHVAFHEAGIPFDLEGVLLVELDQVTKEHAVTDGHFSSIEECPSYALTMSLDLVFQARSVLVLANGTRKTGAIRHSLLEDPTPEMPMSYAQIYSEKGGEVVFVLDDAAARGILDQPNQLKQRNIDLTDLR